MNTAVCFMFEREPRFHRAVSNTSDVTQRRLSCHKCAVHLLHNNVYHSGDVGMLVGTRFEEYHFVSTSILFPLLNKGLCCNHIVSRKRTDQLTFRIRKILKLFSSCLTHNIDNSSFKMF